MAFFTKVFVVILVNFVIFKLIVAKGGTKGYYSDEWLLKTSGGRRAAKVLADGNGFEIIAEIKNGYFVIRKTDFQPSSQKDESTAGLSKSLQVESLEQMKYLNRTARSKFPESGIITDSAWSDMWHAQEDTFPSMRVFEAWRRGYSGEGVHISILDDGVEPDHPDLVGNYDASGSYDYLSDAPFVNHTDVDFHGTWCAGVVSAVMNDDCVLGMAYMSTFGAVKIFDSYFGLTDFGESFALTHELSRTHIYSNSWGPLDSGDIFEGPGELAKEALSRAMQEGRNGLGPIYTWAAGNGGIYDDCNCDGYAGSIYTISVTAIGHDQAPSWYSEECSSIMVGTYSGDSPDLTIATTDTFGGCTTFFQGTSASCPMAAGIIALVLEANPTLTWRDVQHLIVDTSTRDGLINANWHTNGAGYRVSHAFGFGILNADRMVEAALSWQNVPSQVVCESETINVNGDSTNGVYVTDEHVSNGCTGSLEYVEHVEVAMSFHATYRGSIQISLISPSGTRSRLLRPRRFDIFDGTTGWTFMTVHNWGELASGTWTLQLETTDSTTDRSMAKNDAQSHLTLKKTHTDTLIDSSRQGDRRDLPVIKRCTDTAYVTYSTKVRQSAPGKSIVVTYLSINSIGGTFYCIKRGTDTAYVTYSTKVRQSAPGKSIVVTYLSIKSIGGTFYCIKRGTDTAYVTYSTKVRQSEFGLDSWKLILYGTSSAPANNPQAQISREPVCDDDSNTGAIIGGVLGGVALLGVAAALVYVFVIRKPIKDPTVFPDGPSRTSYQNQSG